MIIADVLRIGPEQTPRSLASRFVRWSDYIAVFHTLGDESLFVGAEDRVVPLHEMRRVAQTVNRRADQDEGFHYVWVRQGEIKSELASG